MSRSRVFTIALLVGLIGLLSWGCCTQPAEQNAFPELSGPYLGQTPPGLKAQVFAPGIVNTPLYTRDLAMTPDGKEIYFGVAAGGYRYTSIAVS